MSFRAYFFALDQAQRSTFADRVGSSSAYLSQVAYGNKQVDLGFADVLVAVSEGRLKLADLPLTERALQQHQIRTGIPDPAWPHAGGRPCIDVAAPVAQESDRAAV